MSRSLARHWWVTGIALLLAAGASGADRPRQWHALPVAGGPAALAHRAGLEPGLPAWRVLYEACRRRRLGPEPKAASAEAAATGPDGVVPLPLAPELWRRLLGENGRVPDERLAFAIAADRRSALLYAGLSGLDEETLGTLAADADALDLIRRRHAEAFAAFAGRFAVREGTVVVPGGSEAEAGWQAVAGESPRSPTRFLLRLVAGGEGRLLFLFDSLARLDPVRQRSVLGLTGGPASAPEATLAGLAAVFEAEAAWWRGGRAAFARPEVDPARVLREVRLLPGGGVAPPSSRAFWAALFDGGSATLATIRDSPAVETAWLAARVGSGDPARRRLRLEQLSFAQRVFGAAAETAPKDALLALSGLSDTRALLLALERMGSRDPAVFAAAASGARSLPSAGAGEQPAYAGYQGALGVLDRARGSGVLDGAAAEALVLSLLAAAPPAGTPRGLAGWLEQTLLPALAGATGGDPGEAPDTTLLRALAGAAPRPRAAPLVAWEGLFYEVLPERAELRRLEAVRRRQRGRSLAAALRGCRESATGRQPCDAALGEVLTSIVYAAHLGEPDGPALRGEDPARRHAFLPDAWALPIEVSGPGVAWHVEGSLLGLETALARLSLHRLDADQLPERPPVIDATQRSELAISAGLLNPVQPSDADRDTLAAAVAAGRRRVLTLAATGAGLAAAERDAALDPWRARALEWLLAHDRAALPAFFSLGELARLGAPEGGEWDAWGAADLTLAGLRLRLPSPGPLDQDVGGRPEPALARGFVDLAFRVALHLSERRLPARLSGAMVATLLPDLFLEARPLAPDDRLGLDAWVREQPAERLDDAVASLVGRGPLQPVVAPAGAR